MDTRDRIVLKGQIELTELIIEGKEKEVWVFSRLISRLDWNNESDIDIPLYEQRIKDLNRDLLEERRILLFLREQLLRDKPATRASYCR